MTDLDMIKDITIKEFDKFVDRMVRVDVCNNSTVQPPSSLLLHVLCNLKDGATGFSVVVDGKDYAGGAFVLTGEEWRKRRHSISPAFSTYKMRLVSA